MRHSPLAQSALPLLFAIGLAFVLQHFVGSLAWAGLLAVITWPLHERLVRRGWPRPLSATFLVLLLVAAFAGPGFVLVNALSSELAGVQRSLAHLNETGVPVPAWLSKLPMVAEPAVKWWNEHLAQPGGIGSLVRSIVGDMMPHLTGAARTWGSIILANALYLFLALLTL